MKAKITITFGEDTVDTFMDLFNIDDYSKVPEVLKALLIASIKMEDDGDQLDELAVEMIE